MEWGLSQPLNAGYRIADRIRVGMGLGGYFALGLATQIHDRCVHETSIEVIQLNDARSVKPGYGQNTRTFMLALVLPQAMPLPAGMLTSLATWTGR